MVASHFCFLSEKKFVTAPFLLTLFTCTILHLMSRHTNQKSKTLIDDFEFSGDIIGVASPTGNLDTDSLLSKPQYSGGEAAFNFAVKLYDLNIRRTLGAISTDRIAAMSAGLNTGNNENNYR